MSIKYKRPSGTEIEVSDTEGNREQAAALGWKEVKEAPKKAAKKQKAKE